MPATTVTIPGRVDAFEMNRELPEVCIVCGTPAEGKPVSRTFHYWHPAILLGAPLIFLPFVLLLAVLGMPSAMAGALGPAWGGVLMAMGQRVKLATPVCGRHRWTWAWRSIVVGLTFVPCIGTGIAAGAYGARSAALAAKLPEFRDHGLGAADATFAGAIAGMALGVIAFIGVYLLLRASAPRLLRVEPRGVTLLGVSPAFADAVQAAGEPAEQEAAISREPRSTKSCPHCGKQLPQYAEACRFCKRILAERS